MFQKIDLIVLLDLYEKKMLSFDLKVYDIVLN
jgi:hypothetical protein